MMLSCQSHYRSLVFSAVISFVHGDHLSGKRGNVSEFDSRRGKLSVAYFKFGATSLIIRLCRLCVAILKGFSVKSFLNI